MTDLTLIESDYEAYIISLRETHVSSTFLAFNEMGTPREVLSVASQLLSLLRSRQATQILSIGQPGQTHMSCVYSPLILLDFCLLMLIRDQ